MDDNLRFNIFINIPNKSKPYFFPLEYWTQLEQRSKSANLFHVDFLSGEKHGCPTNGYPYTQSVLYNPPFFIIFKTGHTTFNNFLKFTHFFNQAQNINILAMVNYDDSNDSFVSTYTPQCSTLLTDSLPLTSVLEFYLIDSKGKMLDISNHSQLFISLILM